MRKKKAVVVFFFFFFGQHSSAKKSTTKQITHVLLGKGPVSLGFQLGVRVGALRDVSEG